MIICGSLGGEEIQALLWSDEGRGRNLRNRGGHRCRHGVLEVGFESHVKTFPELERRDCSSDSGNKESNGGERPGGSWSKPRRDTSAADSRPNSPAAEGLSTNEHDGESSMAAPTWPSREIRLGSSSLAVRTLSSPVSHIPSFCSKLQIRFLQRINVMC